MLLGVLGLPRHSFLYTSRTIDTATSSSENKASIYLWQVTSGPDLC